jgi:protein-tyrosine phosphatase
MPISEILEHKLFLSEMTVAIDRSIIVANSISLIVNVTNSACPNKFTDAGVKYLNVNIEDGRSDIFCHFDPVADFIASACGSECVLVHCVCGVSRSATLVIAYLMKHYTMSLKQAFDHVKSKRPEIKPNPYFADALQRYEKELNPSLPGSTTSILEMSGRELPDAADLNDQRFPEQLDSAANALDRLAFNGASEPKPICCIS